MASQHALRQTPSPPRGQTHTCKNITLATTSLRPVNIEDVNLTLQRLCARDPGTCTNAGWPRICTVFTRDRSCIIGSSRWRNWKVCNSKLHYKKIKDMPRVEIESITDQWANLQFKKFQEYLSILHWLMGLVLFHCLSFGRTVPILYWICLIRWISLIQIKLVKYD